MCSGPLAREGGGDLGTRIAGRRETPAVFSDVGMPGGLLHEGTTMGRLAQ